MTFLPLSISVTVNQTKKFSADGIEQTIQANHLSHFLLTNLLLDRMIQSAPSRIVNVSSTSHTYVKPTDFDIHDVKLEKLPAEKTWSYAHWSYSISKLMNILFTRELARRLYGTSRSCFCEFRSPTLTFSLSRRHRQCSMSRRSSHGDLSESGLYSPSNVPDGLGSSLSKGVFEPISILSLDYRSISFRTWFKAPQRFYTWPYLTTSSTLAVTISKTASQPRQR